MGKAYDLEVPRDHLVDMNDYLIEFVVTALPVDGNVFTLRTMLNPNALAGLIGIAFVNCPRAARRTS